MPLPKMRIAGEDGRPLPRRVGLTKTFIEKMACPDGKRDVVVYDAAVNGLCVYVTPTAKNFYLYRKWHGRPLKMKLGAFPELSVDNARKLAMKHLGQMVQGVDPREERKAIRASATLQELYDRWEKEFAKPRHSDKTQRTDKSRFDTCFADWKNRKIATIREHDVRTKHAELADKRGQVTANRAIQLLRRMFNFGRVRPNPASNRDGRVVDFFDERSRERFLTAEELPRFVAALDTEPNTTLRDFFYISLLTGARRSNVESMRWDEIDLAGNTWTIPGEKMKNGQPMRIHLTDKAKQILDTRKTAAEKAVADGDVRYGEWVFPSKRFDAKTPHVVEPKAAWKRILDRAKIKDLRVHDLRRTLGSWQALLGASLPIIGKSLGHLDQNTTQIYARLQLDPVRASVDAAAAAIMAASAVKQKGPSTPHSLSGSKPDGRKRRK